MASVPPDPHPFPTSPSPHIRGRGTSINPANRYESISLHILGEHVDEVQTEYPDGQQRTTQVFADNTKTIINPVDSPDLSFKWTINPYRGCEHGCIYCYARPTHEYLSLSSGLDFETKIYAKHTAPDLLRKELLKPSWKGESIMMSGITDPYQPIERELRITRRLLEVMLEFRQPVALITKNKLILRDLDLLEQLNAFGAVSCAISLTSLDPVLAGKLEPRASSPRSRLETIKALSSRGIPVAVMTAPIIPRINDHELPALLQAAADAGATRAGYVLLRLPYQIKGLFLEWLTRHFPDRAAHVETLIRDTREGMLYDSTAFVRQTGEGPFAAQIKQTFKLFSRKYNLDRPRLNASGNSFRRPLAPGAQIGLFGE